MTNSQVLGDGATGPPRVGLQVVLRAIRNWWLWCLLTGVPLGLLAAWGVWLLFEPVYRATAWLQITDRQHVAFPGRDDTLRFVRTQKQLLRSPVVLNAVVSDPAVAQQPDLLEEEDPLDWLSKQLYVDSVGDSDIFQIRLDAMTPDGAKKMVDAVLESYLKTRASEVDEQTVRLIQILEEDLSSRKGDLNDLKEKVRRLTKQAAGSSAAVATTPAKREVETGVMLTIADLRRQLTTAELERQMLEVQIKMHQEEQLQPEVPEYLVEEALDEHDEVKSLQATLDERSASLHELNSLVKPDGRVTDHLKREVEHLEKRLAEARKEVRPEIVAALKENFQRHQEAELADLNLKLRNAKVLEEMLKQRLVQERSQLADSDADTLDLEFAKDELGRAEQIHKTIADRIEHLRTEMRAPERVTLLSQASLPKKPVEEIPYKNMIIAGLAGLGLPFLLAVFWELRIRRIAEPDQVSQETSLPVLGEVTALPLQKLRGKAAPSRRLEMDRDTFEESIDYLRTSLLLSHTIDTVQVIAVASATSNEGKSSLASHLAVSLARAGNEPVLLIDADLRDPDVHRIFGFPNGPGVAAVLGGRVAAEDSIVTSQAGNLHFLPAGRLATSPHVLLGEGRFAAMLERLRPLYRHIVVDTPPVLPAGDALIITQAADGTLLCTMRDVSRGPQVRLACERLSRAGARLLGAVLSGVPRQTYVHRYGSYQYTYSRNGKSNGHGQHHATNGHSVAIEAHES